MPEDKPIVISVNSKDTPGLGKIPRDAVTLIANHGMGGDYHAGPYVRHRSRAAKDPQQPNRRQVHLMHSELFDDLAPLGINVTPGAMGENITTRGLALLHLPPRPQLRPPPRALAPLDLAAGTKLRLGDTAVIEVTGCRNPCAQLNDVDERLLSQVAI